MNNLPIDTDLLQYLPTWYRDIADFRAIIYAETVEATNTAADIHRAQGNLFFAGMDAAAVREWELIFGIIPDPSDTLEFRRARLINRISTRPPFTVRTLRAKLDELIGPGEYTVIVDNAAYTIYIEASAENAAYAVEMAYTVNKIKPAHIAYVLTPFLVSTAALRETIKTQVVEYNYKLGSWGLGLQPFSSVSSEVTVKMATTPSIKPELLNDMAASLLSDIASARVNGSIAKTSLTKSRDGSTVTVSYSVTAADTAMVNRLELLDSDGNVLTASDLYIPITETTTMKHIINVNEGVTA